MTPFRNAMRFGGNRGRESFTERLRRAEHKQTEGKVENPVTLVTCDGNRRGERSVQNNTTTVLDKTAGVFYNEKRDGFTLLVEEIK